MMILLIQCSIAEQDGVFSFMDVAEKLNEKIISRHDHVFKPNQQIDLKTLEKKSG